MKLLRNVTAVTAAVTLSASVFALPALAQEATDSPSENSATGDNSDDRVAEDAQLPQDAAELDEGADQLPGGPINLDSLSELTNSEDNNATEDEVMPPAAATAGVATISTLDIAAKMNEYISSGTKVPTEETWMARVYNHENANKDKDWLDRVKGFTAYSPSMNIDVPLAVITPDGTFNEQRPTIYMLNGAGGAEQGMDWITATSYSDLPDEEKIVEFYKDKNVNVVIPQAGAFSYYTDWVESPRSGYLEQDKILWETFLTKELPGPLEAEINGNDKRAIAGMSMSATSALVLAEHVPGFYNAVGSFSGCAATSRPFPNMFANITVNRGGGNTTQMWGPQGGKYNVYNDGLVNANNLEGSEVYVSANSGLPGITDMGSSKIESQGLAGAIQGSSTLIIEGGVIEAAANSCTHDLKAKMDAEGVAADWNFRSTGTHSWPAWRKDLTESWGTFARGLGLAS